MKLKITILAVLISVLSIATAGCAKQSPVEPEIIIVTGTYTATPTITPTPTATGTYTITPDYTGTPTFTHTVTQTAWVLIATNTVTETQTDTITPTFTPTATSTPKKCFIDNDSDGHGDYTGIMVIDNGDGVCLAADKEADVDDDCNDNASSIYNGAPEIPGDGIDQDCNGADTVSCVIDSDHDGYGTDLGSTVLADDGVCDTAQGESTTSDDCNDAAMSIYPGASEIINDGIDQDCNGVDSTICYTDNDHDGYGDDSGATVIANDGSCDTADGESATADDCDDTSMSVHPGASEITGDGIDQDCSGSDTVSCVVDSDHDGYGADSGATVLADDGACDTAQGESTTSDDCNDSSMAAHPGAEEIPGDSIDQNCDGSDAAACYMDADNDGYGDSNSPFLSVDGDCDDVYEAPTGYDCNDTQSSVYPGATEIPGDSIDQNCNGDDYN